MDSMCRTLRKHLFMRAILVLSIQALRQPTFTSTTPRLMNEQHDRSIAAESTHNQLTLLSVMILHTINSSACNQSKCLSHFIQALGQTLISNDF